MTYTPDQSQLAAPSSDQGLYGPNSVAWRIHSDPSMLLAGFRALVLEATHPLVMAGFAANSGYRDDPWGRLQRTGEWIATVTFGTTAEAEEAGAHLRALHARLGGGVEPETGRRYRVGDPALLKWVHCTEVESFLSTYRRCGGLLEPGDGDRYVAEMRQSGRVAGLDPATLPTTERQIQEYYRQVRPELKVTAVARSTVLWGFAPPMPRWVTLVTPARPAWAALVSVAFGMVPSWARRLYGLPGWGTTDVAASLSGRFVRQAMLSMPSNNPQSVGRLRAEARLNSAA